MSLHKLTKKRGVRASFYAIVMASMIFGQFGHLSFAVQTAHAAVGTVWTTDLNCATQDKNSYNQGEDVWLAGSGFLPGASLSWDIDSVPPSGAVASGVIVTDASGEFCFNAYTVGSNDEGVYKATADGKTDNYSVAAPDPVCGNDIVEAGEQCDDGNTDNGDGCDSLCHEETTDPIDVCITTPDIEGTGPQRLQLITDDKCFTPPPIDPICGNGIIEAGETCDDGNTEDLDGCDSQCQIEQVDEDPFCGDGTVNQEFEQCDDGNTEPGDGCNERCQEDPMVIVANKIVCDDESLLPNWGAAGMPDITETTAQTFVDASFGHCWLEPDWDFQWGYGDKDGQYGVDKLTGDHIGPGDGTDTTGECVDPYCGPNTYTGTGYNEWKTFGPTDTNGTTSVEITDLQDANRIWVRENLKEGYIPFTYPTDGPQANDTTAEIYCHTDTFNFDNYDNIDNPELGNTYYCVAFNAPKPITIVAHKIICDEEQYLPNWGEAGVPNITETTASDFIAANSEHCWLEPDWTYQWGFGQQGDTAGVHKLTGTHIGEADGTDSTGECAAEYCGPNTFTGTDYNEWKTFGPTDTDGTTSVNINYLYGANRIWVRENLKEGYIPFTYPLAGPTEDNVTAEIYCHTDTFNFDNYDNIDNPIPGETYYCVAFNSPIQNEEPICNPKENLFHNPSFEDPVLGSGWQIILPSNPLLKWLVNWMDPATPGDAGLEIQTNGVTGDASDGVQFAELDGNHPTRISQVISTIPGKDYTVTFDYSPRPGRSSADNALVVTANGEQLGPELDADGTSNSGNVWTTYNLPFTATTTETIIEFSDLGVDNSYGVYLDNMNLACIGDPEKKPYCGDESVNQESEQCDDGNNVDGDGCDALCQLEPIEEPFCGDLIQNGEEQCDGTDGVGDHQECTQECELVDLPYCGDGTVNNDGEQCDGSDGLIPDHHCTAQCVLEQDSNGGGGTTIKTSSSGGGGGGGLPSLNVFNEKNQSIILPDATVTWFSNINANCRAVYDTTSQDGTKSNANYGYTTSVDELSGGGTFHTATLTGIQQNNTYYWRPVCTSGSLEAAGIELSFETTDEPIVLGITNEPEVDVLGFELLPDTGGPKTDYYVAISILFSILLTALFIGYRGDELN